LNTGIPERIVFRLTRTLLSSTNQVNKIKIDWP
jgi:hypothetical protein